MKIAAMKNSVCGARAPLRQWTLLLLGNVFLKVGFRNLGNFHRLTVCSKEKELCSRKKFL